MQVKRLSKEYMDQFVQVVDEYRAFCGFRTSQDDTKTFFQNLIKEKRAKTFIAINHEDRVMGFVNLYPSFSTLSLRPIWILNDLGVSSRFRRLGVAQTLVEKAVHFAEQSGAIRIELKTATDNENAQKLYSRIGFKKDEKHIHYSVPVKE